MTRACVPALVAASLLVVGCGGQGGGSDDARARTAVVSAATPGADLAGGPPVGDVPRGVTRRDAKLATAGLQRTSDLPDGWEQDAAGLTGTGATPTALTEGCVDVRRAGRAASVWRAAGTMRVDDRYDLIRELEQVVVVYPDARSAQASLDAFVAPATQACVARRIPRDLAEAADTAGYGARIARPRIAVVRPSTTGDAIASYRVRTSITARGSVTPLKVGVDRTRVGRVVVELVGIGTDDSELRQAGGAAVARLAAAGARR